MAFLYPAFLLGLGVLAAPIILHLMSRVIPKRLVFPSIRFIRKGQRFQSGRKGLRDLWTLLARMLVLAVVVLLFAAPFFPEKAEPAGTGRIEIVLFYDLSLSMRAYDFHAFFDARTDEIMKANPDAKFALVASARNVAPVLPMGTQTSEIRATVKELQPDMYKGNHYSALKRLEGLFSQDEGSRKRVYIFSDLQRQDWSTTGLPRLTVDAEYEFVKPTTEPLPNVAITHVYPEIFARDQSRRLRVTVQLRNFSFQQSQGRIVLNAGQNVARRSVTLDGDQSARFVLDLEDPKGFEASVTYETEEPYLLDNVYHFWIGPQPPVTVAIVDKIKNPGERTLEGYFLANALTASLTDMQKLDVRTVPPTFVWEADLNEYQAVVILDSISGYTDMELKLYREYVEAGGTLVYFCGDKTIENLNLLTKAGLSSTRFRSFEGGLNPMNSYNINAFDLESPILSMFSEESSDLLLFLIHKMAYLQPPSSAKVLLSTTSAAPLLIQENRERGTVFIFAINLMPTWSEFPTSMSFLPVLRKIVDYGSTTERHGIIKLSIGDNYAERLKALGYDKVPFPETAGVHLVETAPVELNVTREESDLRGADELAINAHLRPATAATASSATQPTLAGDLTRPFRTGLGWALLLFMLLELLFANMRGARPTATEDAA